MSEPIEVVRKEFSESYVSLSVGGLYAWWQVDKPEWVRVELSGRGTTLVVAKAELVALVKAMEAQGAV